jgi:hypothetical protein
VKSPQPSIGLLAIVLGAIFSPERSLYSFGEIARRSEIAVCRDSNPAKDANTQDICILSLRAVTPSISA